MNRLARAGGHENLQQLRAGEAAARMDHRLLGRCLHQFDARGLLLRCPSRRAVQSLALFGLRADLSTGQEMRACDASHMLNRLHGFGNPATLRQAMISCGLLTRRRDSSDYRRGTRNRPLKRSC